MTDPAGPRTRGRGRGTKEAEAREYLRGLNIDPDDLLGAASDEPMPATPEEFRDELMKLLWKRRHSIGDTAFANLLKALTQLMEADSGGGDAADEPLAADVVAGITNLPDDRKRAVLEGELAVLDAERARILEVLDEGSVVR